MDNGNQLLGGGLLKGLRTCAEMRPHMVLDDFRHQTGHGTTDPGDQVHDLIASGFGFYSPLYGFDLAANAANSGEKLLLFTYGMGHLSNPHRIAPYALSNDTMHLSTRCDFLLAQSMLLATFIIDDYPIPTLTFIHREHIVVHHFPQ
jgi:hypothetical protein